jgi:hypothetical protein
MTVDKERREKKSTHSNYYKHGNLEGRCGRKDFKFPP